ncbi:MAG: stage II sporulation protein M [Armatimonadetes bacterium]|nr:stage II sporulation protein M [Armatimonadota bacterium]
MNQDLFVEKKRAAWEQLNCTLKKLESQGLRGLTESDAEALPLMYRKAASDLAYARLQHYDSRVVDYLNDLVRRSYGHLYASEPHNLRHIFSFFAGEFPRIFRKTFAYFIASFLFFAASGILAYGLVRSDPQWADLFLPENLVAVEEQLAQGKAGADIPDESKPFMSSFIMTNNIKVGVVAFSTGILLGLGTLYVLIKNGLLLGALAAVFAKYHLEIPFWSLILPHGVMELTAIFICGASGFLLGHALLEPGKYSRRDALTQRAQEAVRLVAGVIPLFVIAAIIEGFVTPMKIPEGAKLAFSFFTVVLLTGYFMTGCRSQNSE